MIEVAFRPISSIFSPTEAPQASVFSVMKMLPRKALKRPLGDTEAIDEVG